MHVRPLNKACGLGVSRGLVPDSCFGSRRAAWKCAAGCLRAAGGAELLAGQICSRADFVVGTRVALINIQHKAALSLEGLVATHPISHCYDYSCFAALDPFGTR